MLKQKRYRILLLIVVVIASIYGISKIGNKQNFPLFQVHKGEFLIDIYADGILEAGNSTVINSPTRIWGDMRITRLVDEGKVVKEGDLLIQFDTAELLERIKTLENELEQARASFESAEANIEKTKADLESQLKIEEYTLEQNRLRAKNAKYEAENKRKEFEYSLKKAEINFQQLVDKIEKTKEINKATLRQSEIKIDQAELSLNRAKENVQRMTITSPGEGLVVYKKVWAGGGGFEKIKVGTSVWNGMALMEIPDKSNKKVIVNIDEVNISSLKLDQVVNIKIDALPEKEFKGRVTKIASLAKDDEDSGKKVFEIEVLIDEIFEELKPGMSAECQIIVEQIDDVLSIPIDAITKKEGEIGVYNASGKFVQIKTGKVSSDLIIVEEGLKDGDEIRLVKSQNTNQKKSDKKPERRQKPNKTHRVIIHG
ncbi:HlyD family efflux transporter periplasmic adaptor subunit [Methanococcoides sp. SA1]|nr:HlyD family efflux transporter periplasmic adaptor subunit [Methanococcoides sp. SA1]